MSYYILIKAVFVCVCVWVGAAYDLFNFISLHQFFVCFFCQNFTIMVKRLYNPPTPSKEEIIEILKIKCSSFPNTQTACCGFFYFF